MEWSTFLQLHTALYYSQRDSEVKFEQNRFINKLSTYHYAIYIRNVALVGKDVYMCIYTVTAFFGAIFVHFVSFDQLCVDGLCQCMYIILYI